MTEEQKEFWVLDSENVPFQRGWFYRAFDFQQFMKKIEVDPRGGKVIGMNFDGKNVEFYTAANADQMKKYLEKKKFES